eukprot:scaffold1880_cov128-Skeletonema_menzelii.AAC.11
MQFKLNAKLEGRGYVGRSWGKQWMHLCCWRNCQQTRSYMGNQRGNPKIQLLGITPTSIHRQTWKRSSVELGMVASNRILFEEDEHPDISELSHFKFSGWLLWTQRASEYEDWIRIIEAGAEKICADKVLPTLPSRKKRKQPGQ